MLRDPDGRALCQCQQLDKHPVLLQVGRGGAAGGREGNRLATSICRLRYDQAEQGPTKPHAGRSTFLPSSGGAWGGSYRVGFETGPIPTENEFPY